MSLILIPYLLFLLNMKNTVVDSSVKPLILPIPCIAVRVTPPWMRARKTTYYAPLGDSRNSNILWVSRGSRKCRATQRTMILSNIDMHWYVGCKIVKGGKTDAWLLFLWPTPFGPIPPFPPQSTATSTDPPEKQPLIQQNALRHSIPFL